MPRTKIFQIYYDDASRRKLDPGFLPLDNCLSPDAQWYEFWPILNYLNTNELEDDVLISSTELNKKLTAFENELKNSDNSSILPNESENNTVNENSDVTEK